MILIIGGAFQGKLDYAKAEYGLQEKDVYHCDGGSMALDFDKKIINNMQRFVLACVREGIDPRECLDEHADKLRDKVIISDDISQGVVPMDATEREWREMTGRCLVSLGQQADKVIRVFCGIPEVIKGE